MDNFGDREIVLVGVQKHGYALQSAPEELKGDRAIVLAAVQQDGYALQFASVKLKRDREIVLAAVQQHQYALRFASEELKDNPLYSHVHKRSREEYETDFNCK